jgi:nicotinate phosphoribosyltransferase
MAAARRGPHAGHALVTDLYQATMALVYLRKGMTGHATFSLFVRRLPADRGFLVAAGLESVLDFLETFCLDDPEIDMLAAAYAMSPEELEPLRGLRFTGDVWAVPEGRLVFAGEPLLEVTAPLPEAQFVETFVLNQVSHQVALATKAARCVVAAAGRPVIDFSLRRCHGVEAGMHAARAAAIAGFAATSNVAAALEYGIPATGTMAHSFVEAFGDEDRAFRTFVEDAPGPATLLVDTYDTEQGVTLAADVLRGVTGERQTGIRLDSGDLSALARAARRTLDEAGLPRARVLVSGGLDEYDVDDMVTAGVPVDAFAVGTKVGTSADAPYLDTAYKLVEYDGRPVMKLSTGKATRPGPKQVFRARSLEDVVATRGEPAPHGAEPLLERVMGGGRRVTTARPPDHVVADARRRLSSDLDLLPEPARRIRDAVPLTPRCSDVLTALTSRVREELRSAPGRGR